MSLRTRLFRIARTLFLVMLAIIPIPLTQLFKELERAARKNPVAKVTRRD